MTDSFTVLSRIQTGRAYASELLYSLSEEPEETDELEGSWWENPENIIIDQESTRSLEQEIHRTLSPMEKQGAEVLS